MKILPTTCPNCGVSLQGLDLQTDADAFCPYCHAELLDLSQAHFDAKKDQVLLEKKAMHSGVKKAAIAVSITLLLCLLITVLVVVLRVPEHVQDHKVEADMEHLTKEMADCYEKEDWDGLYELVIVECDTYIASPSYFMYRTAWFLSTYPEEFDEALASGDTKYAQFVFDQISQDYEMRDDFFKRYYTTDASIEAGLKEEYEREKELLGGE